MKMFKRFAAALLAGVMVLAMLTACGGGAGGNWSKVSSRRKLQNVYEWLSLTQGIRHRMVRYTVQGSCRTGNRTH